MSIANELRRIPPLGWLMIGLFAQTLPTARPLSRASIALAAVTTASSLGLLGSALASFRRHHTTVDPFTPDRANQLVTEGPFRITRNPMYVAMGGVLAAHAMARRSPAAALWVPGFAAVISHAQIAVEEASLAAIFGATWDQYAAATPRWLGLRSLGHPNPL